MADDAVDRAMRLGLAGPEAHLLRAVIDHRLARSEAAADRLRTLVRANAPNAVDAPEKIFERVASWVWTSSPMTVSHFIAGPPGDGRASRWRAGTGGRR